jgi:hypothetical protein
MPAIELTHAELGHAYDAVDHGLCALDDMLSDSMRPQFYSDDEWAAMKENRDRWARVLSILADAIAETANAND